MKTSDIVKIHGTVILPKQVRDGACNLASLFYDEQEAEDWSGDEVCTYKQPDWLRHFATAFHAREHEKSVGFVQTGKGRDVVVTAGAVKHIDDIHGYTMVLTLHNDGLKFRQGKCSFTPLAGDWFIFDDRKSHGVLGNAGRSVFVGWTMPIVRA